MDESPVLKEVTHPEGSLIDQILTLLDKIDGLETHFEKLKEAAQ